MEDVVLSRDKVEEPATAEPAEKSGTVKEAVALIANPVRRKSNSEVKLPSRLKIF